MFHDTMALRPKHSVGIAQRAMLGSRFQRGGKKYRRHQLPIEEKEASSGWSVTGLLPRPNTLLEYTLISVGDREADVYELFQEASKIRMDPNC